MHDKINGLILAGERKLLGLTQRQLAQATGYSQSAIEKFENGIRKVPERMWLLINAIEKSS